MLFTRKKHDKRASTLCPQTPSIIEEGIPSTQLKLTKTINNTFFNSHEYEHI